MPLRTISSNTLTDDELDKLFCQYGKKYGIKKLILKAIAICESSLDEHAYRFEPAFWQNRLKNLPEWKDRDPAEVSASWGLMQLMYTTAWALGFRGKGEELYNPVYNIELGTKLFSRLLNKIWKNNLYLGTQLLDIEIAMAHYNGGTPENPDKEGKLRNQKYVTRVMKKWHELALKESECED